MTVTQYAEERSPVVGEVSVNAYPWYALQVRTRYEITATDYLKGKGYECFLPQHKCRKRWSDRIKEVEAAMFPGYLFCRFNVDNRLPILTTPGVIRVVGYNRIPTAVDEDEIGAIRRLVTSGIQNQPCSLFQIGERVRIESGPLAGVEGKLTNYKGKHHLILAITLLQRAVAVEIDSAMVSSLRAWNTGNVCKPIAEECELMVAV